MTEWSIVGVLVVLVSLVTAVVTPMLKLNATIAKLTTVVSHMEISLESLTKKNTESHARMWAHNSEQDNHIQDHEVRLSVLEKQEKKR